MRIQNTRDTHAVYGAEAGVPATPHDGHVVVMWKPYTIQSLIVAMRDMFPSKRLNAVLLLGSAVAFFGSFALIRTQTTIGDTAFLRSMIPHHSGAILMCEQASLKDAEIRELCRGIIAGQAAEIEQMKTILARK